MKKEYVYTYNGKEFSWKELAIMLRTLNELNYNKDKKWYSKIKINMLDFSMGVSEGILYGTKMMSIKEDGTQFGIKIKDE